MAESENISMEHNQKKKYNIPISFGWVLEQVLVLLIIAALTTLLSAMLFIETKALFWACEVVILAGLTVLAVFHFKHSLETDGEKAVIHYGFFRVNIVIDRREVCFVKRVYDDANEYAHLSDSKYTNIGATEQKEKIAVVTRDGSKFFIGLSPSDNEEFYQWIKSGVGDESEFSNTVGETQAKIVNYELKNKRIKVYSFRKSDMVVICLDVIAAVLGFVFLDGINIILFPAELIIFSVFYFRLLSGIFRLSDYDMHSELILFNRAIMTARRIMLTDIKSFELAKKGTSYCKYNLFFLDGKTKYIWVPIDSDMKFNAIMNGRFDK